MRRVSPNGLASFLRAESTGGLLLVTATGIALVVANVSPHLYHDIWATKLGFGPAPLHLDNMTLSSWVADGLLALFFYVVGLELKREVVLGELADPKAVALPLAAALGGMVAPALICFAFSHGQPNGSHLWAIPVATDIAFALGILSLAGARVPSSLRLILLTLAVADDLGGILLIALLFTSSLAFGWLAGAVALLGAFAYAQRRRWRSPLIYLPLAAGIWVCVHASGIHATIAGVALGLLVRARPDPGEPEPPVSRLERLLVPVSAGFVVPIFALSTTGVSIRPAALASVLTGAVTLGIIVGLLVGKFVGVLAGAWFSVRTGLARLPAGIRWPDLVPLGLLAGIGYTVSLLIASLALRSGAESAATAILMASTLASILSLTALWLRFRAPERVAETPAAALPTQARPSDDLLAVEAR